MRAHFAHSEHAHATRVRNVALIHARQFAPRNFSANGGAQCASDR